MRQSYYCFGWCKPNLLICIFYTCPLFFFMMPTRFNICCFRDIDNVRQMNCHLSSSMGLTLHEAYNFKYDMMTIKPMITQNQSGCMFNYDVLSYLHSLNL